MKPRRLVVATAVVGVLALAHACVESSFTRSRPGDDFDRNALLRSLADNVFVSTYAELVTAARALEDAADSYAASLSPSDGDAARAAWRGAMDVWQRGELLQIGPAGAEGVVAGGRGLRDEIYSWPLANRCRIDVILTESIYADATALAAEPPTARGLDVLEYLLFHDGDDNACSAEHPINTSGTWAALTDRDQRRADYAKAVARTLRTSAETLHHAWSPDGDDFAGQLAGAGTTSTVYDSARSALHEVTSAMIYVDFVTKDRKLGLPAGLDPDCANATCPEDVELSYARHSTEAIRQNMDGLRLLLHGGSGDSDLGFDDWLRAANAADVVTRLDDGIAAVHAALDALDGDDLVAALEADPAKVEAVYLAVKTVTDILKSDFVTVLDLELPSDVPADND